MKFKKIKDIVEINPESISSKSKMEYINYLDTANITNGKINNIVKICFSEIPSRAKRIVRKNDILYSTVRPNLCHYGILRSICDNMIVSTGFIVLRCGEEIFPEYLYAYITLPCLTEKLHSIATTTTSAYPSIRPDDIGDLEIPVPDLEKQKKIAKILSDIDKKTEINNKINENIQKISQELYKRWFVDFEFPDENDKPYKSSRGKMVESELGMIPEDWKVGYISDGILTSIIKPGISLYDGEKKYVATADVVDVSIKNFQNISYDSRPSRANMKPINNSVWFAKMQGSNKNILVDKNCKNIIDDYIFSTGFMGLECEKNSIYYIWNYINTDLFSILKDNMSTGTLMAGLSNSVMNNFKYIIPTQRLLDSFNEILSSFYSIIFNNINMNDNLENIKNILLPKLMNGEIDLDNVEI